MTNEPAERLRRQISKIIALPGMSIAEGKLFWENLDAAIAAERRATVERIRAAYLAKQQAMASFPERSVLAILDAEAAAAREAL